MCYLLVKSKLVCIVKNLVKYMVRCPRVATPIWSRIFLIIYFISPRGLGEKSNSSSRMPLRPSLTNNVKHYI